MGAARPVLSGHLATLILAAALAAPGCYYCDRECIEEVLAKIDQDGDGVPAGEEKEGGCDENGDKNPLRFPGNTEVPYDGYDNDCDGADLVDIDGDGFPGITQADYEALPAPHGPLEPFPEDLVDQELDCVDDPAVRAEAADIKPGNPNEVPYDGIDADCARDNDFDADVPTPDGYMPNDVDGEDVEALFAAYVEDWGYEADVAGWAPPGENEPLLGDCDDADPEVNPGVPANDDEKYDGIDENCDDGLPGGKSDFDFDGDDFMPAQLPPDSPLTGSTQVAFELYLDKYFGGVSPFPDHPEFCARPDPATSGGCLLFLGQFDDCFDQPDDRPELSVPPEDVYPRDRGANPTIPVQDSPYDGVDSDCHQDNDYDADRDAFNIDCLGAAPCDPTIVETAYATYKTVWDFTAEDEVYWASSQTGLSLFAPQFGDCDDDPSTGPTTYPQALERIGDNQDQDCDGSSDTSAFEFKEYLWEAPGELAIARIDDYYNLFTIAQVVEIGGIVSNVVGYRFDFELANAAAQATPLQRARWLYADQVGNIIYPALAIAKSPCTGYYVAAGTFYKAENGFTEMIFAQTKINTSGVLQNESAFAGLGANEPTTDVAVMFDDNAAPGQCDVAVALLTDNRVMVTIGTTLPSWTFLPNIDSDLTGGGLTGWFDAWYPGPPAGAPLTTCNGTGCLGFDVDDLATPDINAIGAVPGADDDVSVHSGGTADLLISDLPGSAGVAIQDMSTGNVFNYLAGYDVVHADAMLHDGRIFIVAVVDDGIDTTVELAWGTPEVALPSPLTLPFIRPGSTLVPRYAAIHADDDRLVVAVTGLDPNGAAFNTDAVGWLFLGPPP